jgi:hypothetical protein
VVLSKGYPLSVGDNTWLLDNYRRGFPVLTIRFKEDRSGYDIEDEQYGVMDTVSVAEMSTAESPHEVMRRRVWAVQKRVRVRRFASALAASGTGA